MAKKHTTALSTATHSAQGKVFTNPSQTAYSKNKIFLLDTVKENIEFFLNSKSDFAEDVFLPTCNKLNILLAVSGGVDSQVMLQSVHALQKHFGYLLHVVSVNHNLRAAEESKADADLVKKYCNETLHIHCEVITINQNDIANLEKKRKQGIEEAARFVRYTRIEQYAHDIKAHVVFFAHNKDDQLETLIQHFLQGASAGVSGFASSGIMQASVYPVASNKDRSAKNLLLFRPLLTVTRNEIECYAQEYNIPYNTDSTNNETSYLRNRIRHVLIPVLNEHFIGWKSSVMQGSKKALQESLFINEIANKAIWEYDDGAKINANDFYSQGYPVRVRALYNAFKIAGIQGRIPYAMVHACVLGQKRVEGSGIEIFHKAGYLFVRNKKIDESNPFLNGIEVIECGTYNTEYGVFEVKPSVEKTAKFADTDSGDYCMGDFFLPILIRQKKHGDTILTAQGTHKSVKKIFSEWRIDARHRNSIPCIEYNGELVCIWGAPFGYKDWYVKQKNTEQEKVFVRYIRNR